MTRRHVAPIAVAIRLILVLSTVGCGRSSPDNVCPAHEGLVCDELAPLRDDEVAAFAAAANARDGNTAAAVSVCAQTVVNEQVERSCIDDACVDLCALHPCGLAAAGTCEDNCHALAIARPALDAALIRAAASPGFCSCAVCDDNDGSAPLCTELWVCGAAAP